jgi:hypothetical protein
MVLLLAAALRFWQLTTLPPGLHTDEITTLGITHVIQDGRISLVYATNNGIQQGLYPILLTIVTTIAGDGMLTHRLLSVWLGLVTLALVYTLGVRLFGRLAGLSAMALLAVMLTAVLLSRVIQIDILPPFLVTASLLALARAYPVYRRRLRDDSSTTASFAALAVIIGGSFYTHSVSVPLLLIAVTFTIFVLLRLRNSLQRLSYIGFALLLIVIISVPYMLFTINRPELAANEPFLTMPTDIMGAIVNGLIGVGLRGDANPAQNLPERPLLDLVSAISVLIGFIIAMRYWRQPRFAIVLIATIFLLPMALLQNTSPDFFAFGMILPLIVLFAGLGIQTIVENAPSQTRPLFGVGVVLLIVFNAYSLITAFVTWSQREDVLVAYRGYEGKLAHYLDLTAHITPTVLCDSHLNQPDIPFSSAKLILQMMNRKDVAIRRVDCYTGLVLIDGGRRQQVILSEPNLYDRIPPYIQDWLAQGEFVPQLPPKSVIEMEVLELAAQRVGVFTTMAPTQYQNTAAAAAPVFPPIRLGENVTWLGYDPAAASPQYAPGDTFTLITYWRVDGVIPDDLIFFNHILSDPATIARQRDLISVDPTTLRSRDVFIQIVTIPLSATMLPGDYQVSLGAYRALMGTRLPVFDAEAIVRGNSLLLYSIVVQAP